MKEKSRSQLNNFYPFIMSKIFEIIDFPKKKDVPLTLGYYVYSINLKGKHSVNII